MAQTNNNKDDGNTKARATQAAESALNLTLGRVKLGAALTAATTAETGVGAVAAAYLAISATGNFVAGTVQAIGAATGNTKSTETAAAVAAVSTSVLGTFTMIVTGGNLEKATKAAAVEGIVTSNPNDLAKGGTVGRAALAIEFKKNIDSVKKTIKGWFSKEPEPKP